MSDQTETPGEVAKGTGFRRGSLGLALIPLAAFAGLVVLFYLGLFRGDPSKLPSVLIGKPVPTFDLPPIEGVKRDDKQVPGLSSRDLSKGRVSVINVWASWCVPCRVEHPNLLRIAQDKDVDLVGINYKDETGNARRFLGLLGNPYSAIGADSNGRVAIDWGVYGVPETFVVDGKGIIVYKHVGPISPESYERDLLPAIIRAKTD